MKLDASAIYSKPYAKGEYNFSIPLTHTHATDPEKAIVIKTGDKDIEVELFGAYFRKTDSQPASVTIQIDAEELITDPAGDDFTGFLRANLDRNKPDEIGLDVLTNISTPDYRDGSINIFRSGGLADKSTADYSPNLEFRYRLKRNTSYVIVSTVLIGDTDTSEAIIYGKITVL